MWQHEAASRVERNFRERTIFPCLADGGGSADAHWFVFFLAPRSNKSEHRGPTQLLTLLG